MNCSICYDHMDTSKDYVKLQCSHDFHFKCIFELMSTNTSYSNKCPLCRNSIVQEDFTPTKVYLQNCVRQIVSLNDIILQYQEDNRILKILLAIMVSIMVITSAFEFYKSGLFYIILIWFNHFYIFAFASMFIAIMIQLCIASGILNF